MKVEFFENKFGVSIEMKPETPKEFAQLLRFTKNSKAEKPSIYFSFSGDEPYCNIHIAKVKETAQNNSIRPGK